MSRETRAVVMVDDIPHSVHPDREAAKRYVDTLPDQHQASLSLVWPVDYVPRGPES